MKRLFALLILVILAACTPRVSPLPASESQLNLPIVQMGVNVSYGAEIDVTAGVMADEIRSLDEIGTEIIRSWILYERIPSDLPSNVFALDNVGGYTILMEVKGNTCWIAEQDFDAFFTWLAETVESLPEVDIWEAWNEEDIGGCIPPYFGGWSRPEAGAELYTKFLNRFYATVKQADPDALVMVGSFCLCYSDSDINWNFVEYTLKHGNYDVVGLHHYARYPADLDGELVILGKQVERVREYARPGTPIHLTETSTITLEGCTLPVEKYQADWLAKVTGYARESGLASLIWYGLTIDWECSAMIGNDGTRQVYSEAGRLWR